MKLLTYKFDGKEQVGVLSTNGTIIFPLAAFGLNYENMNGVVQNMNESEKAQVYDQLLKIDEGNGIALTSVKLEAPIPVPIQDVICLGINYMAHAEEAESFSSDAFATKHQHAIYFSKRVNFAVPDGGIVDGHFDIVENLDYEAELAVILGKDAKNVAKEDVGSYIFGYSILNDMSARSLQTQHKQWYFGKSLDSFTPIGPWIVTSDEFDFPPKLKIQCRINGELRQDSNTALQIFKIDHVVSELSAGITLKAGTIIATGTPSGVGMGFDPPQFLKSGDVMECYIEGIGTLTNIIK